MHNPLGSFPQTSANADQPGYCESSAITLRHSWHATVLTHGTDSRAVNSLFLSRQMRAGQMRLVSILLKARKQIDETLFRVVKPPELQFAGPSARKFTLLLEKNLTPNNCCLAPQSCNLLDHRLENSRCSWKGFYQKNAGYPPGLQFAGPSARNITLLLERILPPKNCCLAVVCSPTAEAGPR